MEESTSEVSLLAGLPCRGTLVARACILPGAPRRVVGAPASTSSSAAGPRIVRTEILSLDQWYKRSLRFRSITATGNSAAARARGKLGISTTNPTTPASTSSAGAAAAGATALNAAAAAVATGSGKRAAPWPAAASGGGGGEDAKGTPDQTGPLPSGRGASSSAQQQQPHKRPAGPGGRVVGSDGGGAGSSHAAQSVGPSGLQQQKQVARRAAGAPSMGAPAAATAAAGGRAQARHESFTPEQLQAKTAKELAEMLKARGQSGAGRKEHLVVRLLEYQRRMRRAMQPT